MTGPIVVFLGPTLSQDQARKTLDALYLPPAEQGSVIAGVQAHAPRALVLIDGRFGKAPAVRHKEILWAISLGIPVYGASSMGALRAAELQPFGMKGYGLIFRWYRATPLADDDEVAVAMAPAELGSVALSEALINMRLTLRAAERQGQLTREARIALEDLARSFHFVDRTYGSLFARARACLPEGLIAQVDRAEQFAARKPVDRKRDDALGLLGRLASARPVDRQVAAAGFRMTEAWAVDLAAAGHDWEDIERLSGRRPLR